VQITLNGNKISTTGGNQLVADLTGDNMVDRSVVGFISGGELSAGAFVFAAAGYTGDTFSAGC
jgi:hypothetical protein